jgi:hypothetical protein
MPALRNVSEEVARRTGRRGFFGRGAELLFGALAGAAAGAALNAGTGRAGENSTCAFPGDACPCENCQSNGVCAKPCHIYTAFYASGCWVSYEGATCCDCDCEPAGGFVCGCGTDYHNNPAFCP